MWSLPDPGKAKSAGGASERSLIADARAGSEDAVEELFRRYWPDLHRAAFLIVRDAAAAEDIAQEAFLAAISGLDRFDRGRPLGPWLHRIAANRAIDWSRARSVRGEIAVAEAALGQAAPSQIATGIDPDDEVGAAVAALPVEQRAVVILRYLFEYTPGEIAKMLELPRGTVNSRLRRGLDQLREVVGEVER
jgi:RNA polymerase sigma-70 factor (ECF subfamily)